MVEYVSHGGQLTHNHRTTTEGHRTVEHSYEHWEGHRNHEGSPANHGGSPVGRRVTWSPEGDQTTPEGHMVS